MSRKSQREARALHRLRRVADLGWDYWQHRLDEDAAAQLAAGADRAAVARQLADRAAAVASGMSAHAGAAFRSWGQRRAHELIGGAP